MADKQIQKALAHLHPRLVDEIIEHSNTAEIPAGTEILRDGQYVKVVPVVLSGLIKVFTRYNDRDLLLYYIKQNESCVMSFTAGWQNQPSMVHAITEEDTIALLMPVEKLEDWTRKYPGMNNLFYDQYNARYLELLDTIHHLLFNNLDTRLMNYLKERSELRDENPLKISHRQIAGELGTSREVISRVMKKLEKEGKVRQEFNIVEIL